jgi:hypothetical protein
MSVRPTDPERDGVWSGNRICLNSHRLIATGRPDELILSGRSVNKSDDVFLLIGLSYAKAQDAQDLIADPLQYSNI